MTPTVILINRHHHSLLYDGDRCLVPIGEVNVHLITHGKGGTDGLSATDFPHVTVCDVGDFDELAAICRWIVRNGDVTRIAALHELMMVPAARLRDLFGVGGMSERDVLPYRDKWEMKRTVVRANAAKVADFHRLDEVADLDAMDWSRPRKVIKRRLGAGAKDVFVVDGIQNARDLCDRIGLRPGDWLIEDFVSGPMYHCDSIIERSSIRDAFVSKYLSNPGDFVDGGMGGSRLLSAGDPVEERIRALNIDVLTALGLDGIDGVTHLEVFLDSDEDLVFCEVAARPGGGGIDRLIAHAHGVDLYEAALRLQMGLDAPRSSAAVRRDVAVMGFYPSPGVPNGIDHADFDSLGIVEWRRNERRVLDTRPVSHCTDYRDRYLVQARSPEVLLDHVEEIRRTYWT